MRTRPYLHPDRIHRPDARRFVAGVVAIAVALVATAALVAVDASAQDDDRLITAVGVGDAVVGSTVEQLAAQLGPEYSIGEETRITVDFRGHVVSRDGEVLFRAVRANDPGPELSLFIVNNEAFATAEGVGPGTPLSEAESVYGDATLSWNPDAESREFVTFSDGPPAGLAFRTPGIAGTNVGIYAGGELTTTDYEDDATVAAVWVSCTPGTDCPDPDALGDGGTVGDNAGDDPSAEDDGDETGDAASGDEGGNDEGDNDEASDDEGGNDEASDGGGGDDDEASDDALADTGAEEIVLVLVALVLILVGGGLVIVNRSFLAPSWLRPGRR